MSNITDINTSPKIFKVTWDHKLVYFVLSPLILFGILAATLPDFKQFNKKIMKAKRLSWYICLYMLIVLNILESVDIFNVMNSTPQSH